MESASTANGITFFWEIGFLSVQDSSIGALVTEWVSQTFDFSDNDNIDYNDYNHKLRNLNYDIEE